MAKATFAGDGGSTPPFVLHAWADESVQEHSDGECMYLLAAVMADPTGCDAARQAMRDLKQPGQRKLHWRDEDDPRRRKIAATIAQIDMCATVVIGMPVAKTNPERARRKCLRALLLHLDGLGVSTVYMEARQATLNRKDLASMDHLRGARLISRGLRLEFAHPSTEPMLWLPDAVAGAVGLARRGVPEYRETLGSMVEEVEIDSD